MFSIKALKELDLDDFNKKCDEEANRIEDELCRLFNDDASNESKCPRIPVFEFRPTI